MTSVSRNVGVALVAIASVVIVEAARAADAIQKCEVAKLKAAGREVRDKMRCHARAKNVGVPVDAICLTNAQTKADATINTAGGACGGIASDIDAILDSCVSAFLTDDPGTGACPARSAQKAIADGAKGEIACQAKELTRPGTFTNCDIREDVQTAARLDGAGGGTPCANVPSVLIDTLNCGKMISAALNNFEPNFHSCFTGLFSPCGSSSSCICDSGVKGTTPLCGLPTNGPYCGSDADCGPGALCVLGFGPFCVTPCP